ncbi:MAG: SOS response-associated peptidase [Candidatus Sericytochromatia bacterium]|nr:SOS response-associated peptidase [Candidatus Sericytochromatia bacterium]
MCGRFTLTPGAIPLLTDWVEGGAEVIPRWNIAPTQMVPIVREQGGARQLALARWGLVPPWAREGDRLPPLINARADTVAEKPAFRAALRQRRAVVPADGFYEWAPPPAGAPKGAPKQPWWFRRRDAGLLFLAALWEPWGPEAEPERLSFTLITTDANACVAPVHDRMPVLLDAAQADRWMAPQGQELAPLLSMLAPYPADAMVAIAVNPRLNSARTDEPSLVEPVATVRQPGLFDGV